MSGICGLSSPTLSADSLRAMMEAGLQAMAHRGPDGARAVWAKGMAIGHCLLDTGCNGLVQDADGLVLALDGRIDNLAELAGGLAQGNDPAVLLACLRRDGEAILPRLRGDFACVYGRPGEGLRLVRDHFGVRPLFYYAAPHAFIFASEIKVIRAMLQACPMVGPPIGKQAQAALLRLQAASAQRWPVWGAQTLWEHVQRVLPGHVLRYPARPLVQHCYWRLDPGLPANRPRLAEQLGLQLARAVDRRVRAGGPVGALLSGGLDSSSIVSLIGMGATRADPARLSVFAMVFPGRPEGDETEWIDRVAHHAGVAVDKIDCSAVTALQDVDTINHEQDGPPDAPNGATFRSMVRHIAARHPRMVVLHGHGGDEVFSDGYGLFAELAETLHWGRLWREMGASGLVAGERRRQFARLLRDHTWPRWRKRLRARLARRGAARSPTQHAPSGALRPVEQNIHLRTLSSAAFHHALEVIDHEAAAAGIEMRMPFLDVDLVELCVTVPARRKWRAGMLRVIQREAVRGVLPEAVRLRPDKFDFAPRALQTLVEADRAVVEDTLRHCGDLLEAEQLADVRASWDQLSGGGPLDNAAGLDVWRAVVTLRWLRAPVPEVAVPEAPLPEVSVS